MPDAQGQSIFANAAKGIPAETWRLKGQAVARATAYLTASIGFAADKNKNMKRLVQRMSTTRLPNWRRRRGPRCSGAQSPFPKTSLTPAAVEQGAYSTMP